MDAHEQRVELLRGLAYGLLHAVVTKHLGVKLEEVLDAYNDGPIPRAVVDESLLFIDVAIEHGVDPFAVMERFKCQPMQLGIVFGHMMLHQQQMYVLSWGKARTFAESGQIVWKENKNEPFGAGAKTWSAVPIDDTKAGDSVQVLFDGRNYLTRRAVKGVIPVVPWESGIPKLVQEEALKNHRWLLE